MILFPPHRAEQLARFFESVGFSVWRLDPEAVPQRISTCDGLTVVHRDYAQVRRKGHWTCTITCSYVKEEGDDEHDPETA